MDKSNKEDLLLLAGTVIFNFLIYNGGRAISANGPHLDLTTAIDRAIPVLPWTIVIYWGLALPFWVINYCLCSSHEKGKLHQFLISHYIGEGICFLFFVLFPTVMQRPEIRVSNIFDSLLLLEYRIDRPDNLLPSIHCFVSWLCWIGVRNNREIPKWYQMMSLLMAVAVCLSTLTVKQHVIADVIAGIVLAEFSYGLVGKFIPVFNRRLLDCYSDR